LENANESAGDDYSAAWYEVVTETSLRQGDIFRGLLVFRPNEHVEPSDIDVVPDGHAQMSYDRGDYIVLSASCDVDQPNYPYAVLGRIVEATEANLKLTGKDYKTRVEVLRQGLVPSQFLLAQSSAVSPSFVQSIVQHKVHALLPVQYLRKCCTSPRLRLKHPFREKFGNWVGSCFSRVGPEDHTLIPQVAKIFPSHVVSANSDDAN
jgi:hypothetical protein